MQFSKDVVRATAGAPSRRSFTCAYWPRPPTCNAILHLALGRPGQRLPDKRPEGGPTLASTLNSRFRRSTMISRCSSPVPPRTTSRDCRLTLDPDGRVLGGQLLERLSKPLLVVRRLRPDGNGEEPVP